MAKTEQEIQAELAAIAPTNGDEGEVADGDAATLVPVGPVEFNSPAYYALFAAPKGEARDVFDDQKFKGESKEARWARRYAENQESARKRYAMVRKVCSTCRRHSAIAVTACSLCGGRVFEAPTKEYHDFDSSVPDYLSNESSLDFIKKAVNHPALSLSMRLHALKVLRWRGVEEKDLPAFQITPEPLHVVQMPSATSDAWDALQPEAEAAPKPATQMRTRINVDSNDSLPHADIPPIDEAAIAQRIEARINPNPEAADRLERLKVFRAEREKAGLPQDDKLFFKQELLRRQE
jgi:hypothetical protein